MTMALQIRRCTSCGLHLIPFHLACPRCGAGDLETVEAGEGLVAYETVVHRAPGVGEFPEAERPCICQVVLDVGPTVIARASEKDLVGKKVKLLQDGDGAVIAVRVDT